MEEEKVWSRERNRGVCGFLWRKKDVVRNLKYKVTHLNMPVKKARKKVVVRKKE